MIPHTIVLRPDLEVQRVFNGYYYWGRPSMSELHQELREATRAARDNWDITDPALREQWEHGEKEAFYPARLVEHGLLGVRWASAPEQRGGCWR